LASNRPGARNPDGSRQQLKISRGQERCAVRILGLARLLLPVARVHLGAQLPERQLGQPGATGALDRFNAVYHLPTIPQDCPRGNAADDGGALSRS
jgi:hypothetical protein